MSVLKRLVIAGKTNQTHDNVIKFEVAFNCDRYESNVDPNDINACIERLRNAEIGLINAFTPITDKVLSECGALTNLVSCSAGIDHVDLDAAKKHGVHIRWYESYCARTLAEKTLTMLLAACNQIVPALENVRSGQWSYLNFRGREIAGRNILILGKGASGTHLEKYLKALGANVTCTNSKTSRDEAIDSAVNAHAICVHMALTNLTRDYLDDGFFSKLRPDVVIVNFARGALVNTQSLTKFLKSNSGAIACLDVLETEPPPSHLKLLELPNAWITPHIGWNSVESDEFLRNSVFDDIMSLS